MTQKFKSGAFLAIFYEHWKHIGKYISDVVSELYVPADGPNLHNLPQNHTEKKKSPCYKGSEGKTERG
jgi:hypothetical protein